MKALSLFSGIGGPELALHALGCETPWFSEIEPYACEVFAKRFPDAVNLGDVREIDGTDIDADIIVGGFPCQDISNAGARAGIDGARSGLWGEFARLIGEIQPRLVLIENVSALLNRGLLRVLTDLANLGYEAEWDCIPAAAVGAPHLRDRIWIVAVREDVASDEWIFTGEDERAVGMLANPPSKLPRAGASVQGALYGFTPIAPRKSKRIDGRTYWNGVNLGSVESSWLWPTPSATSYGSNRGGAAGRVGTVRHSLESMAKHGLWPTPTRADGTGGPGRSDARTGGDNLRTAVALYPTPRAQNGEARNSKAWLRPANQPQNLENGVAPRHRDTIGKRLNPDWVEWLMGFPVGWTDLDCDEPVQVGWERDPAEGLWPTPEASDGRGGRVAKELGGVRPSGAKRSITLATAVAHRPGLSYVSRTTDGCPKRTERLTCLGNALVPQVMHFVAARALAAVR